MAKDMTTRYAFATTGFATLVFACGTSGPAVTDGTSPLILQAYGGPSGQVGAEVLITEPPDPNDPCNQMTVGACQLTSCQQYGVGLPPSAFYGRISAAVGSTNEEIDDGEYGYPTVGFPSSVVLETGGVMTFHGDGGTTVPHFAVAATIPGLGIITSPLPSYGSAATPIDTAQDLTVTWMPISIGYIQFALGSTTGSLEYSYSIACNYDGAAGSGAVPHTLLSSLKTMSNMTGALPVYASLGSSSTQPR